MDHLQLPATRAELLVLMEGLLKVSRVIDGQSEQADSLRLSLHNLQELALSLIKRQETVDALVSSVNDLISDYETRFKILANNQNELNGKLAKVEQLLRIEGYSDDHHRNYN